jgi:hypothetical protein
MTLATRDPSQRDDPPRRASALSLQRATFITAATSVAIMCVAVAGGLAWWNNRQVTRTADAAIAQAREHTAAAARALETIMGQVPAGVQQLADELGRGGLRPIDVPARLRQMLEAPGAAAGYGVAFEAFAAGPSRRLFAPYIERRERGPARELDFASLYPYNEYRYGWFCDTLLDGAGWMDARLFPATDQRVALYSIPFSLPDAEGFSGVVFASVPLDMIASTLQTISVGQSGYAFVVSQDGEYLVHPRREFVRRGTTLFETAWTTGNTGLHAIGVRAIQGERFFNESVDELTARVNWIFTEPLPTTGWSLLTVFFRDEFRPESHTERRQLFLIIIFGITGAWLLMTAAAAVRVRDLTAFQWACSTSFALSLAVAIACLWIAGDRYPDSSRDGVTTVFDQGSAYQVLEGMGVNHDDAADPIAAIPTGVYVRSIVLLSGSEVLISGFVWQRYEKGLHDTVPRGFALPEMFDPGQSEIKQVYRLATEQEERIGWYFAVKFRQTFDYGTFPFDRQNAWVRLEPADSTSHVVFVPDFESYELLNPQLLPGVNDELVLPGWQVLGSHFDYRLHEYNTDMGMPGFRGREPLPTLYFNVELKRLFLGPFVAQLVPLGVTAGMLFALLLISSRREASQGLLGFSAAEIVLGTAALFFVASFQHIALRESLDTESLIYFGHFYFVLYVLMMLVSINAILFASAVEIGVIEYADNLIPKILFWPVFMLSVFVITLVQFY